jgi:hypothetical protein
MPTELDGWWFMVFNATFNNISAISWRSILLVEETGVHGEQHSPVASHLQITELDIHIRFYYYHCVDTSSGGLLVQKVKVALNTINHQPSNSVGMALFWNTHHKVF